MKQIILFIIISITLINQNILSQNSLIIVNVKNSKSISKLDLNTRSANIIYSTNKFIKDLTVSPTGELLAFIEMTEGTFSGYEYKNLPRNTLQILDTNTEDIFYSITDDVRVYDWSPQGDKMAYITGKYHEGGVGFSPENTYVLNLETKEKIKIEGLSYPYELHWSVGAKSLFMKNTYLINNNRVFKFDLDNMTLSPTPYHDLHFSPDGQYYYHMPDEIDYNFRIFNSKTNQEISQKIYVGLGSPMGWVFNSGHLFLFVTKDEEIKLAPSQGSIAAVKERKVKYIKYSILDVEKKVILKILENVKIGEWISQNSILPFSKDGKVDFIENPIKD